MAKPDRSAPWNIVGGATNFSRGEAQRFARQILQSQTYRDWLDERVKTKTLDSAVERMLWAYAYGKPPEQINLNVTSATQEDLSELSVEELQRRAKEVADELAEAQAVAEALPADVVKGPW